MTPLLFSYSCVRVCVCMCVAIFRVSFIKLSYSPRSLLLIIDATVDDDLTVRLQTFLIIECVPRNMYVCVLIVRLRFPDDSRLKL